MNIEQRIERAKKKEKLKNHDCRILNTKVFFFALTGKSYNNIVSKLSKKSFSVLYTN